MHAKLIWKENLQFAAEADGHVVLMDAKPPVGQGKAQTPKQLLLAALCGCTAMDVASLMRKQRQDMKRFEVTAEATVRAGVYPAVFTAVEIRSASVALAASMRMMLAWGAMAWAHSTSRASSPAQPVVSAVG